MEGWDYLRDVWGAGRDICREQSVNFMSVQQERWLGWHWGVQRIGKYGLRHSLWRNKAFAEKDAGLGFAFFPSLSPQKGRNWTRLRIRGVHLRGKALCVYTR